MVVGQVIDQATIRGEVAVDALAVIGGGAAAKGGGVEVTAIPAEAATGNQCQAFHRAEGHFGVQAVLLFLHAGLGAVVG
ncbi:hypothetical protein D9M71_624670 [compost metagenome]